MLNKKRELRKAEAELAREQAKQMRQSRGSERHADAVAAAAAAEGAPILRQPTVGAMINEIARRRGAKRTSY